MTDADDAWPAQEAFFHEMMGKTGVRIILNDIHRHLPCKDIARDLQTSYQFIKEKIQGSGLYKVSTEDARLLTDECVSCLAALVAGDDIPFKSSPVSDLQKIYSAMTFFLRTKNDAGTEIFGKDAFQFMMSMLEEVDSPVKLFEYMRWGWLGNDEDRKKIETTKNDINEKAFLAEKAEREAKANEKAEIAAKKKAELEARKAEKASAAKAKAASKKTAASASGVGSAPSTT